MRIIVRLVVILAIIAGLAYGGLWGYSYYRVKTAMDNAVEKSAQFADIKYKAIYVSPSLDGTVGVDGVVIKPKMTSDEFKIQSVRLTLPGIIKLFTANKEDFPESMRLAVSGIVIDLNSPLLVALDNMQKQAIQARGAQHNVPFVSYETLGCGSVQSIGIGELTRMGYQTMEIDFDMEYRYAKIKNLLSLSTALRMKGMQSVDIKSEMRIPPSELAQGKFANLVLDSVIINITDSGYAALRNRFCAAQLESTEETYLGKNLELLSREVGATFPPETVEAYKKSMQGGRVSLELSPKPGIEFTALNRYPLRDVIDMLGIKVTLDSHQVDFDKFEWGKSYSAENPVTTKERDTRGVTAKVYVPPAYHAVSPSQLPRYDGYKVRLKTSKGIDREGVISAAEADTITLQQNVPAKGFITFQIAIADVTSAEVFY